MDRNPRDAALLQPDPLGGALGKIDSAAVHVGTSIVDSHYHRTPGLEVGHPHTRAERETARSGGEVVTTIDLAAGGALSYEAGAVPGGERYVTGAGGALRSARDGRQARQILSIMGCASGKPQGREDRDRRD